MKFERVAAHPDAIIPTRATKQAAGYDFYIAEDIIIPSYSDIVLGLTSTYHLAREKVFHRDWDKLDLPNIQCENPLLELLKKCPNYRPTLVPTGVKVYLDNDKYLQLSARSSLPRKNWLIVANAPGIVDADYVDNPDNEGQIYVQLINLAPFPFTLHKGEKFAQGVILQYFTVNEEEVTTERMGGFGSTGIN